MKNRLIPLSAAFAVGVLSMSSLRADYTVPMTDPPFSMGKSVIGIEGWEHRSDRANDDAVRLVKVRWDDYRPALFLYGASIKNDFPKTHGTQVRVTLKVAFSFPMARINLQQFRLLIGGAPFPEIAFQANSDGGIGFGDGTGRSMEILVPYKDVKSQSFYTITALIDFDKMTYDITITGVKADGSPLSIERKEIPFNMATRALQGMSIITAKSVRVYISQLSIESL